jgi:signal transduction histidine kinase
VRETFQDIAVAGQRASEVIQSIRGMFKMAKHEETALNANELIRETIALMRTELEAERILVQLDLNAQVPLVFGHRGQLQQVFLNLVSNAAEAMLPVTDRARVLKVTSEAFESDCVAVLIADSGTGIESKNIDRIFDAFFTTKPNGMGMGLPICRSIVDAHGGSLTVTSGAGHGAVFRIVLPSVR